MDSNNRGDPDGDCDCDNEQGECSTDFSLILFLSRSNCVYAERSGRDPTM